VPPTRKGLAVTRSFGRPVSDLGGVLEAVAAYATRAGEKLRAHGLVAGQLAAFLHTNPHQPGPRHHGARSTRLVPMTDDTRELVAAARRCVEAAWKDGFAYAKAGVVLDDLRRREDAPRTLFEAEDPRAAALMRAMDGLNAKVWAARRLPGGDGHPALLEAAGRALLAALHHPAQRPAGAAGVAAGMRPNRDRP
jgi:DNA polymerase V